MATAVKSVTESAPRPQPNLLRASLVGALYVVLCLALVFFGLPFAWKATVGPWVGQHLGAFFDPIGMATLIVAAAVGLLYLGKVMADQTGSPPGLRAGVFSFVAFGLLLFLVTVWIGRIAEGWLGPTNRIGLGIMLAAAVAIVYFAIRYALGGGLEHYLIAFEQQGWFNARSYKPSQGRLVRRLTMAGIIVLVASGVWALDSNKSLRGDWKIRLPFTTDLMLPDHQLVATLLPDIRYTIPLLLLAGGLWLAWRAVNYPTFADFLIATEAELNKVSWTSRRRLIQDTVVVLVTLFLFTVFLLVVDQLWGWLLTRETLFGGIVPKPPAKQVKESKETSW
jgi:preprotein translocase SecE subunit